MKCHKENRLSREEEIMQKEEEKEMGERNQEEEMQKMGCMKREEVKGRMVIYVGE